VEDKLMEETFEMAVDIVMKMINEDRPPTQEEKGLLAKMVGVALFDLHSIAKNLERIANSVDVTRG
jgi:hypothetical protein